PTVRGCTWLRHPTPRYGSTAPEVGMSANRRHKRSGRSAGDIRGPRLIVPREGYRHNAEITLRLKRHEMVSREQSTEPRSAIELAADHIEQQLRRLKEKRVSRKREPRNGRNGPETAVTESDEFDGED